MKATSLGVVTLFLTLLGGLWLMYAPFAIGYQAVGSDWTLATRNDLVVAILVVGISLVGLIGFLGFALQEAVQAVKKE
jgi:hypothetical protein